MGAVIVCSLEKGGAATPFVCLTMCSAAATEGEHLLSCKMASLTAALPPVAEASIASVGCHYLLEAVR